MLFVATIGNAQQCLQEHPLYVRQVWIISAIYFLH
jgi:hypothetical protein